MYKITDQENQNYWDETVLQLKPVIYMGKFNKKEEFKFREYELDIIDCETEMSNRTQVQFEESEIHNITKNKKYLVLLYNG